MTRTTVRNDRRVTGGKEAHVATRKTLDAAQYKQIVTRLKRGDSRKTVMEDLNVDASIVGKVSVHAGIAKPKSAENKKRDVAAVDAWLAASKDAERRPARTTAKTTIKKATAKKSTAKKQVAVGANA